MSNIALIGSTGNIGQRILNEALSRGHKVTAIVRDITKTPPKRGNLDFKPGDVLKPESVAIAVEGNDVVVCSYGPRDGDPKQLITAARSLIEGISAANKKTGKSIRLIVVGGAASLEIGPGSILLDSPNFPPAWKPVASAARDALQIYRTEAGNAGVDWTYFSPAAFIQPGTRTGKFRLGTDQLVVDSKGESRISNEDYAVALIDEIEKPQFIRKRFTVAY